MRTDKRFKRTRENWQEFANAGKAGKLIRRALALVIGQAQDRKASGRLMRQTMRVVKSDPVNKRGERIIKLGDFSHLLGFEFNANQPLSTALKQHFMVTIDRAAGTVELTIPALVPEIAIAVPEGTTHFRYVLAAAALNWEEEVFDNNITESALIPFGETTEPAQTLSVSLEAGSIHTIAASLGLWFYQEVNGEFYLLNDGSNNAMALVGIDNN